MNKFEDTRNRNLDRHMMWLQKWSNQTVKGKTIKEWLEYEYQTMFYLFDYFLLRNYIHKNKLHNKSYSLEDIMTMIDLKQELKFGKDNIIVEKIKIIGWIFLQLFNKKRKPIPTDVLFLLNKRFVRKEDKANVEFGTLMNSFVGTGLDYSTIEYSIGLDLRLGIKDIIKIFKIANIFKDRWKELKNNNQFKKTFKYNKIYFFGFAKSRLELVFNVMSYLVAYNIVVTKKLLEIDMPRLIMLDHDNSFYGKGLMINAKKKDTKFVALQHELVHPNCNHTHIKDEYALDKHSLNWRPLPTYKCVWSNHHKNILMEHCNYPVNIIQITGNPKFDLLVKLKKYKVDIESDKKYILFPAMIDNKVAEDIIRYFYNKQEYILLIKPHPLEDMKQLKKVVNKYSSKNIILYNKDRNLYKEMQGCNIIITHKSTIGIEAMIMDIPIIEYNPYDNDFCRLPYLESKAVLVLKNLNGLRNTLDAVFSISKEAQQNFLNEQHPFLDGCSTKRVMDLIKEVLT